MKYMLLQALSRNIIFHRVFLGVYFLSSFQKHILGNFLRNIHLRTPDTCDLFVYFSQVHVNLPVGTYQVAFRITYFKPGYRGFISNIHVVHGLCQDIGMSISYPRNTGNVVCWKDEISWPVAGRALPTIVCVPSYLTYWGKDNMVAICRRYFQMHRTN